MQLGFSYVGCIFLILLFVPNLIWTKNKPKDYDHYVKHENKVLLGLERIGEILTTTFVLIFADFNYHTFSPWFLLACIFMFLYECYWIRYFKSKKTMQDFYSSFLGIPVAGATCPVLAFLSLSMYGKNILLLVASILLGIGHIGIHLQHKKEVQLK